MVTKHKTKKTPMHGDIELCRSRAGTSTKTLWKLYNGQDVGGGTQVIYSQEGRSRVGTSVGGEGQNLGGDMVEEKERSGGS